MNGNTFQRAIVPILFITLITAVAIYCITTEYNKEKHDKAVQKTKEMQEAKEPEQLVDMDSLEYTITGVLIKKNTEEKSITVKPVDGAKDFLLEYDGTTIFSGKHENNISIDQLLLGEIIDVTYSVHSGKLKKVVISDRAFTMTDISKFEINEKRRSMKIGDDTLQISKEMIISYGDTLAELMDITQMDTLTVKGIDREIYAIIVDRGHGYIRLQNDAYFVGGWIEVGQEIIKPITSEMLLPVPEGKYHVKVTHKGYAGEKDMIVERDKEAVLDLDKVDIQEVAIGHVEFKIDPDYAQLSVDGEITEYLERVPIEYGIHRIHVELAGYESVDTNIKVLSEYANVEITLEKADETESSSSSSSTNYLPPVNSSSSSTDIGTSSSSTTSDVVISENRQIYVESPIGAEVYLDGNYIGIAPAHTNKVTGQHVLTLSKSGYTTKSYTINIDSEDRDVTFSFSDLIAE